MSLPSIFDQTPFSPTRIFAVSSAFIRPMHPKTEVKPDAVALGRILKRGWCAQAKIHGHRAQIHVPADQREDLLVFNRHGQQHKKEMEAHLVAEIRRLFTPKNGWNAIDVEWLKPEQKIFVFDFIKFQDKILSDLTFPQRWEILPRIFASESLSVLPILHSVKECLELLNSSEDHIEGVVLKSLSTPGFQDTSIVRCRKVNWNER